MFQGKIEVRQSGFQIDANAGCQGSCRVHFRDGTSHTQLKYTNELDNLRRFFCRCHRLENSLGVRNGLEQLSAGSPYPFLKEGCDRVVALLHLASTITDPSTNKHGNVQVAVTPDIASGSLKFRLLARARCLTPEVVGPGNGTSCA